jgi:hypothetical protein
VVPPRYKHLKRAWPSHDRYKLKKEFAGTPTWKAVPKPPATKGMPANWPEKGGSERTGLLWKGKVRVEHPIESGTVIRESGAKSPPAATKKVRESGSTKSSGGDKAATKPQKSGAEKRAVDTSAQQQKKTGGYSDKKR